MALVQAARFLQYYRRLAVLKQAFDADLQDIVLPTMEFFRPEAPDIARHRGEDLCVLTGTITALPAQFPSIAVRPSGSAGASVGSRSLTVLVIEQIEITTNQAAVELIQLAFAQEPAGLAPGTFTKGFLKDSRASLAGTTPLRSQSEVATLTSAAAPVSTVIGNYRINSGGGNPTFVLQHKFVLFPPVQLIVIGATAAEQLTANFQGYERTLEPQEAI